MFEDTRESPVETNLALVSLRYYSPELCRFIQPADVSTLNPLSITGLNLYSYANNNPIGIAYGSFGDEVATSGSMVSAVRKTNLSLNGNTLNSAFDYDPNFLGNWFAHNENIFSAIAGIFEVKRTKVGLPQYESLARISKVLMHFGYWLNVGLSAHNNFTNEELSRRE